MTDYITRCRPLLGTYVEIAGERSAVIEAGFTAIERVNRLMNAHDPDSEISMLNRTGHLRSVTLHPWTAKVIRRALHWAKRSYGAFDPTIGSLMRIRGQIPANGPKPSSRATWRDMRIDGRTMSFRRAINLDLGGIAKGFAVDCAVEAMRDNGGESGLVNAGGDIRAFGDHSWPVTVVDPLTRRPRLEIPLNDAALATSAVRRSVDGQPTSEHLPFRRARMTSVSVLANLAIDADALTKIAISGSPRVRACLELVGARAVSMVSTGEVVDFSVTDEMAA